MTDKHLALLTTLVDSRKEEGEKLDKLSHSMFGMEKTQTSMGEEVKQISAALFTGPDAIKSKVDVHAQEIENLKTPKRSLSPIPIKSTDPKTVAGLIGIIMAMIGLAATFAKWH